MTEPPVVAAPCGRYRGVTDETVEVFRGIRYAEAPVGPLRLRAPRPLPADPDSLIDATRFGPAPPQVPPFYLTDVEDFSEDCLTLNLWRPVRRDGPLPVLVWLYGGGFKAGATAARLYDGSGLAARDAVVVSVNYRVGALGFGCFAHRDQSLAEASNLALRDVIAALQWIQGSVAAFGGDPARVCVVGQSAGAFLAGALPAAPSADGLYRRVVPMSGGPYKIIDGASARAMGDAMLEAVGIAATEPATAGRLRIVPDDDWVAAPDRITSADIGDRNGTPVRGLAVVDDHEFPDGVLAGHPMEARSPSGIELLLTTTSDEAEFWRRLGPAQYRPAAGRQDLHADMIGWGIPPDRCGALIEYYEKQGRQGDAIRARLLTDWIFHLPEARAAIRANATGSRAWLTVVSVPDLDASGHFDDTPHLFGTAADPTPAQQRFGERYRAMVVEFARNGAVGWKPFAHAAGEVGLLSDGADHRPGRLAPMLAAWSGIDRP